MTLVRASRVRDAGFRRIPSLPPARLAAHDSLKHLERRAVRDPSLVAGGMEGRVTRRGAIDARTPLLPEGVGREDGQRPQASGGHQADREKLRKLNGRRTSFVRRGGDSGDPGRAYEGTEERFPGQAFHLHGWSGDDLLKHPAWRESGA